MIIGPVIKGTLLFISGNAYWICLFVGLGGIFANMVGFKKGGKVTMLSVIAYWAAAAICSVK